MGTKDKKVKIEGLIRKHKQDKKWISVMVCVALLTGSLTMYTLNKPATAVTEDGASSVGMTYGDSEYADSIWEPIPEEDLAGTSDESNADESVEENADAETETSDESNDSSESGENSDETADAETSDTEASDAETTDNASGEDTTQAVDSDAPADSSSESTESAAEDAPENTEDQLAPVNEEQLASEDGKDIDIPESVDLADYITETIVERLGDNGEWEVIDEADIREDDKLRITVKYRIPAKVAASEDIHYDLPKQYGEAEKQTGELEDGTGEIEVTEDNRIQIQYNDEVKSEVLGEEADDTSAALNIFEKAFGALVIVAHAEDGDVYISDSFTLSTSGMTNLVVEKAVVYKAVYKWDEHGKQYLVTDPSQLEEVTGEPVKDGTPLYFHLRFHVDPNTLDASNPDQCSFSYDLSNAGFKKVNAESGRPVKDLNGNQIGTYSISENGMVTFYPNAEYVKRNSNGEKLEGYFDFVAAASKDSEDDSDEKEYKFNDKVKITVRILKNSEHSATVYKQSEGYDPNTGIIKYSIRIQTGENGTGSTIDFDDVMSVFGSDGKTYDSQLTSLINFNNWTFDLVKETPNGTVQMHGYNPQLNGNRFSIKNLPALEKGETYKLTYSYKVPDEIRNQIKVFLNNKASIEVENINTNPYEVNTEIGNIPNVNKNGVRNEDKTITWTITINSEHKNLGGYVFTDDKIMVSEDGSGEISVAELGDMPYQAFDANGNFAEAGVLKLEKISSENGRDVYGYRFTEGDTRKYVITYTRPYSNLDKSWNGISNKATIWLEKDPNVKQESRADVWIPNEEKQVVDKEATGMTEAKAFVTIDWSVRFIPNILRNSGKDNSEYWTYTDEIQAEANGSYNQVITPEQASQIRSELQKKFGNDFEISFEPSSMVTIGEDGNTKSGYTGFVLKVKRDLTEEYTLSYKTTGYISSQDEAINYANFGYVYRKDFGDKDSISHLPTVIKMDGNGNTGTTEHSYYEDDLMSNGILTWRIALTIPDDFDGTMTIEEQLPKNVTLLTELPDTVVNGSRIYGLEFASDDSFVSDHVAVSSLKEALTYKGKSITFDGSKLRSGDGNILKILLNADSVSGLKGQRIYLRVRAKMDDWKLGQTIERYENTVAIKDKDGAEIGTSSQTQVVTRIDEVVEKSGKNTNKGMGVDISDQDGMEYTLDINKDALDLLPNGDTLTLIDTLHAYTHQTEFTVNLKSLVVYEIDKDGNKTELDSSKYSYAIDYYYTDDTGAYDNINQFATLEMKLPDEKHLEVVYVYKFQGPKGTNIKIDNSAVLKGISNENESSHSEKDFIIQDDSAKMWADAVNVYKVDDQDMNIKLSGATFELYKLTLQEDGSYKYVLVPDTKLKTDGDGLVTIKDLECKVPYLLKEVGTPPGYIADNTDTYFRIIGAEETRTVIPESELLKFYSMGGVDYTLGTPIFIRNTKNKTSIEVKKIWEGEDGDTSNRPESIKVVINRSLAAIDDSGVESYHTVNILRRTMHGHYIKQFVGLPSVKSGSDITLTVGGYKDVSYQEIPTITVNGTEITGISSLFDTSGEQVVKVTIKNIAENSNIIITGCNTENHDVKFTYEITEPAGNTTEGTGTTSPASADDFTPITLTIQGDKAVNEWTTVQNLEKYKVIDGITYKCMYYIESEEPNIYYNENIVAESSNGGELVVKNIRNKVQSYTLPSTGSTGGRPFTQVGFLLLMISILGCTFYSQKDKQTRFKGKGERLKMKGLKKLLTGILAGAMALTMTLSAGSAVTAKADGNIITVNNPSKDQEYKLYKIFDFAPSEGDSTSGVYTVNDAWKNILLENGAVKSDYSAYIKLDDNGYVEWVNTDTSSDKTGKGTAVADFAKKLYAVIEAGNAPAALDSHTADEKDVADKKFTFTTDSLGYYMVSSTLGALVSLNTTTPNADVYEKNDVPTIEKEVKEDSTGNWGDKNDAQIGQVVEYKTTVNAKAGGTNYKVHDKMDEALTFDSSSVTVTGLPSDVTWALAETPENDDTFTVVFTGTFKADATVVVTYSATVNENAVVGTPNINDTYLEYNNGAKTEHDTTETYIYQFSLVKTNEKDEPLAGAEFQMTNAAHNNQKLYFILEKEGDATNASEYRVVAEGAKDTLATATAAGDTLVTPESGKVDVRGLDADKYVLTETKAPTGYNILTASVDVTVSRKNATIDGAYLVNNAEAAVKVVNYEGTLLPSTGGIGTTIFYIIGGLLIVAAVVFFVVRRKADSE